MDFFKSVFSDDPEPSPPQSPKTPNKEEEQQIPNDSDPTPDNSSKSSFAWSFGGLIKTLTTKSESVLETYRRDLEEFSSGLKQETIAIRQAATRAVKDLPGTLDVTASVAHESLESVGQAIDELGTTVSGIIAHGKEALLSNDHESDFSPEQEQFGGLGTSFNNNSGKYYTRFESQVRAIQNDLGTYSDDPEDLEEFGEWKLGFVLDEKEEEIRGLIKENGVVENYYYKLVPSEFDDETFWGRYFYRIYKLKQVEEARADLVRRAISGEEEEELTWDIDDDDDEAEDKGDDNKEEIKALKSGVSEDNELEKPGGESSQVGSSGPVVDTDEKKVGEESTDEEKSDGANLVEKVDSCSKDSDFSVVSSQPSVPEEEDMGWDEIEDLSSIEDKKVSVGDSPNKVDLRKRLSAADEEEDLTWDIEDDEEPSKQ